MYYTCTVDVGPALGFCELLHVRLVTVILTQSTNTVVKILALPPFCYKYCTACFV